MALLTPLPLPSARSLLTLWGLDVTDVQGIPAGSVNSNYALHLADGGRVFLRIFEEQGPSSASAEARLLEHLAARGVPTPCPLPLSGKQTDFLAEHAGKPVAIFPWVHGESICQRRMTPDHTRQVGQALARLHLAGESFEGAPPSRFGLAELTARLAALDARPLPYELAGAIRELAARIARLRSEPPLPEGALIHGDLFRDNVLWDRGSIAALLDFESASRGSLPFDLMVTMLAWCFGDALDLDLVRSMVAGYRSIRELSAEERGRLYDAASLAALRFSITRITDYELRPPGVGVYKDYRRFLARLRAIEQIGRAAWPAALGF